MNANTRIKYDIIIIGGGAAGLVSAKLAVGLGKKVALVEKHKLGGDCTLFGCVPSKTLIRASTVLNTTKQLKAFGLKSDGPIKVNTDGVMTYVRSVVESIAEGHSPARVEGWGVKLYFGNPKFINNNELTLNGETLSARKFIICTGSSALVPPIQGIDAVPYMTNETIFELNALPQSLVVLGGGPIGIELASAMNRLGVKVTVVEMLPSILFREDKELVGILTERLVAEGLAILSDTKATAFRKVKDGIQLTLEKDGKTRTIDTVAILVAVGRMANVDGLALDHAGVVFDKKGIKTDAHLRTTVPNIYACGDVVGPYQFSHMAEYQAVIAGSNALLPFKKKVNYDHVCWSTFTDPELAHAGLTEEEARSRYGDGIRVYRHTYAATDRGFTDNAKVGMSKCLCTRKGKLLGVHILGSHATEIMHEANVVKTLGSSFAKIRSAIHAYPSYSDVIRQPSKVCYVDLIRDNPIVKCIQSLRRKGK